MAVLFALILVGVFHGYVSGYPTKGICLISCLESLATLGIISSSC